MRKGELDEGLLTLKKQLNGLGITVRFKRTRSEPDSYYEFSLENVPLYECMMQFDINFNCGWIVYEDGSITYFDSICSGRHPYGGIDFHKSQYEAGHPKNFDEKTGKWKAFNEA